MRFGGVSYLNARPLLEGLSPLVLDVPAGLVERYRRGELDVALLPVASGEALALPRVGDLGIAAEGPVDSVLLFHAKPPPLIRRVVLDPESRTSRALALLHLRAAYGIVPEVVDSGGDAELVIGDRALVRSRGGEARIDLAEAWTSRTGLPFVFAAWYGDPKAAPELAAAFRRGARKRRAYAKAASRTLGLPAPYLERYLEERVRHRIGPREREGLARFVEEARRYGLL